MSSLQKFNGGDILIDEDAIRVDRPWQVSILPPNAVKKGARHGVTAWLYAATLDSANPVRDLTPQGIDIPRPKRPVPVEINARALKPGRYRLLASFDFHDASGTPVSGYIEGPFIRVYQ